MPDKETLERAKKDKRERQSADDTGRRIHARGDRAYSRRKTWRTLDAAGYRDRSIKSAPRGCGSAAAEERHDLDQDTTQRTARL